MTDIELEPLKLKAGDLWPSFYAVITQLRNEITAKDEVIIGKDALVIERDGQIAASESRTVAVAVECNRLAALLAEASAAFDAGDFAKLTSMRAAALQTETEKKLAAALAKKAEAESEIAALAK